MATKFGENETVRSLVNEKVDVNAADTLGNTALHHAAKNRNLDIIRILLNSEEIEVNTQNMHKGTALGTAEQHGIIF
ncbi:ankyrin repeat domain-containing protein [Rickettsiales endosymbiont of Stachyamoeba lipophora]|uniref:ankyrin repeat domain-containing protein n=1 Tax=Rickettsiales endosymbiont of Stachyamoeba lipophora TaxID=2486578 RepID=UPI002407DC20|nr:ankyrin repeat domain-containing protein [Rickettsiales endosymbiont of Stachyamoeba lipophora]